MLDSTLRNSEPPRIWDNTMRCMLSECPRKLYFFLRRFDYALGEKPAYFAWGSAYHEGLLQWYTNPPTEPNSPAHLARTELAVRAALTYWDNEGVMDGKPLNTRENLERKVRAYFEENPEEPWKFVPLGGEVGWVWPLNSTYELGGALDGYAEWPEYGMFFLENKSTGNYLTRNFLDQWWYSSQVTGYSWYLSKLIGTSATFGGLINCVTKNIKGPNSRWTTPEFDRVLVKKQPWELEQFEEDFTKDLEQFERYWTSWYWPQRGFLSPTTCTGGPGKSPCLYRHICKSGLHPEDVDPKRFPGICEVETKWEPWKRKEEQL